MCPANLPSLDESRYATGSYILTFLLIVSIFEAYINKPTAKLPYSKLIQYGITMEGLPAGLSLKHPSSYGKDTLKEILSKKDQLKIQGSYVK